jgi:hypothetical protein
MFRVLRDNKGYSSLTERALKSLRVKNGFVFRTSAQSDEALNRAEEHIVGNLHNGQGAIWGARREAMDLRAETGVFLSRHEVLKLVRKHDEAGVDSRQPGKKRTRGRYIVKGPNRVWSVDGHDKLSIYGFQIYGIIDAYSRKILGLWVGISNRTQVAVQKFFLECVREYGFPKTVRADKGQETTRMAVCQAAFRRSEKEEVPFRKAFAYGPSTKNQRIEAWWNLLIQGCTKGWMGFFSRLTEEGYFTGSKFDRIAIRHIYMEALRLRISRFVQAHNMHKIRSANTKTGYYPGGRPNMLYHYPPLGIRNYSSTPNEDILQAFEDEVKAFEPKRFETPETALLCTEILLQGGFSDINPGIEFLPGLHQRHVQAYIFLRDTLKDIELNQGTEVTELLAPRGGQDWVDRVREAEEERLAALQEGFLADQVSEIDMDEEQEDNETEEEEEFEYVVDSENDLED